MTSPIPHHESDERARLERAWLEQLRVGDERAFEQIFRAFAGPLCSFAMSYVRARDVAEEIVQELFCRLWEQRFTLEMPRGMRPYLYSAVRNRALNVLRNQQAALSLHDRLSRDDGAMQVEEAARSPHDDAVAQDLAEALVRAVAAMPRRCREVFTLLRYQHLSYAEVAHVLAISPKTIEIHMTRALAILREQLAPWLRPQ
jgi:RNA polymerase sigma-70 factor, ECF subfamily